MNQTCSGCGGQMLTSGYAHALGCRDNQYASIQPGLVIGVPPIDFLAGCCPVCKTLLAWDAAMTEMRDAHNRYAAALRQILRDTHEANVAHTVAREALSEGRGKDNHDQ